MQLRERERRKHEQQFFDIFENLNEKMCVKQVEAFYGFKFIGSLPLIFLLITGCLGRLTEVPKNNFVLKGTTVKFTCCSDVEEPFFWKVKYISSPSMADIYDAGLVNGFRVTGRFNVTDESRSGCYRLTIADIRLDDAGTYLCIDRQGMGQQMGWELVIVESFDCQEKNRKAEYMGENKFDLPEDILSTVCLSKYFGNIPPKPVCEWSSGTQVFDNHKHVTETNLTATLTIQMPARKDFNEDQLRCHLKIDGEASDNQATTAWKSSHLIVNYASFHQRGVSQCSVDDLFLDCQPPCNYKTIRFSNGSSYCEITYPRKTHKKFFVSLQENKQSSIISSNTNSPAESQAQSSGILPIVTAVLVTLLICGLAGAIAIIIILKRKKRQPQERELPETTPLDSNSGKGNHIIARPGIVINMGDGNNVTVNTVYGDQQSLVTTRQENVPFLRAHSTIETSRTPGTPTSEPENVSVRGVAVLGEHLFFAYRGSSQVRVYSANTLGYKTSWTLNEITKLQDVTACSENNCLYISNIKQRFNECEILKVSPQGSLITNWETGTNSGRLSVTYDFNVLLTAHFNRKIVEYQPDGTLLKEIHLADTSRPNYALKVNSDFYVSHGFGEDPVHGVSQIDAHGEVVKGFGNTKGSTNEQLDTPVHLVMSHGSIWVADSKNGRVVALSPSLEYQATLLSKEEDDLGRPLRICIDQTNRRLLLSDFQNQNHFLRAFNFI